MSNYDEIYLNDVVMEEERMEEVWNLTKIANKRKY
jgi:hypothetical protein